MNGEQISNLNIVIEIRGLIQSKGNEWSTSRQNEKCNLNNRHYIYSPLSCSKTFPPSVEYKRRYFVLVTIKLLFVFHTMKVNGYHQAFSCNLSFVFKRRNSCRLNLLKVSILRIFNLCNSICDTGNYHIKNVKRRDYGKVLRMELNVANFWDI